MPYKIQAIPLSNTDVGKSPFWNPRTQSLYYVDLYCPAILRYDFGERETYKAHICKENVASFVIPIQHVKRFFVVGLNRKVGVIEWDGISKTCCVVKILFEVESDKIYNKNRFHLGKIDPEGRFFGSTMCSELDNKNIFSTRLGKLYKFQGGQKQPPIVLLDNIGIPSGCTWNPIKKKFYFIDSVDFEVKEYDYNPETGDILNPKVVTDFSARANTNSASNSSLPKFIPNDVTIDSHGYLYVCGLGNSSIYKIDPSTGVFEKEIVMPTKTITAITFGGPDMNILYVTTASKKYMNIDSGDAGKLYQITNLDTTGIEMKNMKLKLCLCSNDKNK